MVGMDILSRIEHSPRHKHDRSSYAIYPTAHTELQIALLRFVCAISTALRPETETTRSTRKREAPCDRKERRRNWQFTGG